jgi:hypothetical protein
MDSICVLAHLLDALLAPAQAPFMLVIMAGFSAWPKSETRSQPRFSRMPRFHHRSPAGSTAAPHYAKITSSQSGVAASFHLRLILLPFQHATRRCGTAWGTPLAMDGWVEQTRSVPEQPRRDDGQLGRLWKIYPETRALAHHTSREELISAFRRQVRDVLCIRKADRLVGRRLRDLSLRPVFTHDPAPQVNCPPRARNSTQEARWRAFCLRVG